MNSLKLNFELEKPILPKELDRLLVSFLKATAQNYSEEFFNALYDKSKSITKMYTYCCNLFGARFEADNIILSKNAFTMFFSDADLGELIRFFNAFKLMKGRAYPMNGNSMKLTSMVMQKQKEIKDSEIVVKMQSSLIVRRHDAESNKDTYYTYEHEEFSSVLKENVEYFLKKMKIPVSAEGFSITPIKAKKVVVPVFGRNTDASLGIYKITGSPELLNILYHAGAGSRRSEGHGKFEVIL